MARSGRARCTEGRGLHRLPRRAHRQGQARPATRCACNATRPQANPRAFRRCGAAPTTHRASLPHAGFGRRVVRGLPHAAEDLHAGPGAARSRLRVPRPDLSVKIGTPNACTGCHADKSAQWAADQVERWYGPKRRQEPHFGEAFAAARARRGQGYDALAPFAVDAAQPGIVRASAVAALRVDGRTGISERIQATRDADPECAPPRPTASMPCPVAQRLLRWFPCSATRCVPCASPRRAACRRCRREQIEAARRPAYEAALAEYVAAQNVVARHARRPAEPRRGLPEHRPRSIWPSSAICRR